MHINSIITWSFDKYVILRKASWKAFGIDRSYDRMVCLRSKIKMRTQQPETYCELKEAATGGIMLKKLFLKISQKWQEKTCVEVCLK